VHNLLTPRLAHAARLGACILGASLLAACGGAPSGDSPDYELDLPNKKTPAPSGSSGGGDAPHEPAPPLDPADGSSLGGESTPSDGGAGTPPPATPSPTTVTVQVNGTALTVDKTNLWVDVSKAGTYDFFINVSGGGLGAGSDLHMSSTHTGSGCDNLTNFITYRPANDTQYMPKSVKDTGCGLVFTALPTAVGDRLKGSFHGTLIGINQTPAKSKTIDIVFDVLRTK